MNFLDKTNILLFSGIIILIIIIVWRDLNGGQ